VLEFYIICYVCETQPGTHDTQCCRSHRIFVHTGWLAVLCDSRDQIVPVCLGVVYLLGQTLGLLGSYGIYRNVKVVFV
jgi:hypothetical protein